MSAKKETTMVSARVDKDVVDKFEEQLRMHGVVKSTFLRACMEKFNVPDRDAQVRFLDLIGFRKKETWVLDQ